MWLVPNNVQLGMDNTKAYTEPVLNPYLSSMGVIKVECNPGSSKYYALTRYGQMYVQCAIGVICLRSFVWGNLDDPVRKPMRIECPHNFIDIQVNARNCIALTGMEGT